MSVAQAQWLPQYAGSVGAAPERLAAHERNGTRVELVETEGAARLHTKTVEEMPADRAQARSNADAADKRDLTTARPAGTTAGGNGHGKN